MQNQTMKGNNLVGLFIKIFDMVFFFVHSRINILLEELEEHVVDTEIRQSIIDKYVHIE